MIEDKTYKIKTWDHNDAVIYVYTRHTKCLNPDADSDDRKYKEWKEVIAVLPVNNDYDDIHDESGKFHCNVRVTVEALTELYGSHPDYEVGISYVMNTHQYISV